MRLRSQAVDTIAMYWVSEEKSQGKTLGAYLEIWEQMRESLVGDRGLVAIHQAGTHLRRFRSYRRLLNRSGNRNVVEPRYVFPHQLGAQRSGEVA